jgi:hypothetical protein
LLTANATLAAAPAPGRGFAEHYSARGAMTRARPMQGRTEIHAPYPRQGAGRTLHHDPAPSQTANTASLLTPTASIRHLSAARDSRSAQTITRGQALSRACAFGPDHGDGTSGSYPSETRSKRSRRSTVGRDCARAPGTLGPQHRDAHCDRRHRPGLVSHSPDDRQPRESSSGADRT